MLYIVIIYYFIVVIVLFHLKEFQMRASSKANALLSGQYPSDKADFV